MMPARRHPDWIKARAPTGRAVAETRAIVRGLGLHTVCEEAQCPNLGECWSHHTATVMLLGDTCTRNCHFCAVSHGRPLAVDPHEPARVAEAVERLGLRHVVMTSVNRDDLPDGGAAHFAATAEAVHVRVPDCTVEVLIPDLQGNHAALATIVAAPIAILNHNTETVPRLYKRVRPGATYERSLGILARRDARRNSRRARRRACRRVRRVDARAVPTSKSRRAAGRALCHPGRICGTRGRGPRARLLVRRIWSARTKLVSRLATSPISENILPLHTEISKK
jgi:lipoate synthase